MQHVVPGHQYMLMVLCLASAPGAYTRYTPTESLLRVMTPKGSVAAMPDITEAMVVALFKDLEVLNITRDNQETKEVYLHVSSPVPLRKSCSDYFVLLFLPCTSPLYSFQALPFAEAELCAIIPSYVGALRFAQESTSSLNCKA